MSRAATLDVLGRTMVRGPWRTIVPGLMAAELQDVATGVRCRLLRREGQLARVEVGVLPDDEGDLPLRRTLMGWTPCTEREALKQWAHSDAALGEVRAGGEDRDRQMVDAYRAALRADAPLASERAEAAR